MKEFGEPKQDDVSALAWIAFCRLIIETSSAAFNHVSMSFHDNATTYEIDQVKKLYQTIVEAIMRSVKAELSDNAVVYFADSREPISISDVKYSHVVTSPPYPNRISYIRELRPYMYWLKLLNTAKEAGEIDWKAIGGTWGVATSRLNGWESTGVELPSSLHQVVSQILDSKQKNAQLMAKYVWKYFHDMHLHLSSLRESLVKGATLSYLVGNSSFYGVRVNTEKLLEASLRLLGYTNIGSKIVRKRNIKKHLFEYCVYATWQKNNSMFRLTLAASNLGYSIKRIVWCFRNVLCFFTFAQILKVYLIRHQSYERPAEPDPEISKFPYLFARRTF